MDDLGVKRPAAVSRWMLACGVVVGWGAACSVANDPGDPVPAEAGTGAGSVSTGGAGTGGNLSCGDGVVQAGEDCDDAGESASCDDDCTAAECGDGTTNQAAGEECDEGAATATCTADCMASGCGDGVVNDAAGEECDDGNTMAGDGCSDTCILEGSCTNPIPLVFTDGVTQVMGTTEGESQFPEATCDGEVFGGGSDTIYELTVTAPSRVVATVTGDGWDALLRVTTAPCDPATERVPPNDTDGCANVGAVGEAESLTYVLPPGTYYVVVDGVDDMAAGPYTLDVTATEVVVDCADAKTKFPTAPSGPFLMDPDGPGEQPPFENYCDMTEGGGGWTLVGRFSNADAANWMIDTGEWWYTTMTAQGDPTSATENLDMLSPAFWSVPGAEMKITRSDEGDVGLLVTNATCLGNQTFRAFITSFGDFQNNAVWNSDAVRGTCTADFGGSYLTTQGFGEVNCSGEIGAPQTISFWSDWGGGDGAVMMIGGGGTTCAGGGAYRADHGLGITEANAASFFDGGAGEDDFGDDPAVASDQGYALNLFVR